MRYSLVLPLLCLSSQVYGQVRYDLLIRGGHVIDPKNGISAVRDVAIQSGKIAAVAPHLDPNDALHTVDATGLYVTPGLVDIHVHVYAGTGERGSYAGDNSLYPDGFTLRVGVTTVADAGCSGWRNFEDFKQRIIDRSKTRVLAFLNIVGHGMRGAKFEDDVTDMEAAPAADMAKRYKGVVVGFKTAHYAGPEWTPVEHAVEAGTMAEIPVMVDFGTNFPRTAARRAGDREAPSRRHLHALLFRPSPRTDRCGQSESGNDRRPQTRRHFRCWPRRRQLRLARGCAGHPPGLPARFHFHRSAHRAA